MYPCRVTKDKRDFVRHFYHVIWSFELNHHQGFTLIGIDHNYICKQNNTLYVSPWKESDIMSLNIVVGAIRDRPLYFSGKGLKGLAVPPPRQKTTFTRKKHFLKTLLYMKIRYFLFKFLKYIEKFWVTLLFFFCILQVS